MNLLRRMALLVLIAGFALGAAPAAPEALFGAPPALAAESASARFDEGEPPTYVVQPGDSLARIAARYDVTIDELVAANGLGTTMLQPGQILVIPVAPGASVSPVYGRIRGNPAFIQRVKAAVEWMQARDPDAFARVEGYVTSITPSIFAHLAVARPLKDGGCAVLALARREMSTPMIAALLYHEASHCYQFATQGIVPVKAAEVYAYGEQLAFMERLGFPQEEIDYYRRVLDYYASQPDDARRIPPPDF
jgi:LysM repeat protein